MKEYDLYGTGEVRSPCISLCRMNARTDLCDGCFRTIEEIAQWNTASNEMKRAIWMEIEQRRANRFR